MNFSFEEDIKNWMYIIYQNPLLKYQKELSGIIVMRKLCLTKFQKILKVYTETLVDMVWNMMNSVNYVENHGKRIIIIFVLIDLKREIKEYVVFVMKAKTETEGTPEIQPFWLTQNFYSIKNRGNLGNFNKLVSLNKQVDESSVHNELVKQKFQQNLKKLYKPLNDATKDTSRV